METQIFAKWTQTGIVESIIINTSGSSYIPDENMVEITLFFGSNEIRSLFPNEIQDNLINWFYANHNLFLRDNGYIYCYNQIENGVHKLNGGDVVDIGYSGLTIINGVVITENAPTQEEKKSAIAEIENAYTEKQKAHFVNGVEFYLSLKGENYEQFKSSLTTSAITSGKAIVIIQSVTGIQYKCPDLPFEILKIIFNLVDPYSKNNFDKKGVILRSIIQSTTNQELQTALARKSEFESPATVNINNICDTLLNDNTTPQSVINWLNEKKEAVNNQNVYHIFNQSN